MLHIEEIEIDGRQLVKTYSDEFKIRQNETGIVYDSAIDVPGRYTYTETDEPLTPAEPQEPMNEELPTEEQEVIAPDAE